MLRSRFECLFSTTLLQGEFAKFAGRKTTIRLVNSQHRGYSESPDELILQHLTAAPWHILLATSPYAFRTLVSWVERDHMTWRAKSGRSNIWQEQHLPGAPFDRPYLTAPAHLKLYLDNRRAGGAANHDYALTGAFYSFVRSKLSRATPTNGMYGLYLAGVGRCSLTVPKPVLKAPMISALEATM